MEETKLALQITQGFRSVIQDQDLVSPDLKKVVAVLERHEVALRDLGHEIKQLNQRMARVEANQERDHELLKTVDSRLWELTKLVKGGQTSK